MSEMITTSGRSINTITAEILTITTQTNQMVVMNAIEVGRRLVEAKALVEHGEWGDYLAKEVKFSQSTANNLMKIFREYGDKPNSQALGNLPYTKMVRLLAVPEEEREEFVQQNNVAEISTRELEQAIKERNAAQELLAVAQNEANAAKQDAREKQQKINRLSGALEQANASAKKAERELKNLKKNPPFPEEKAKKIASDAAEQERQKFQAQLDAARQETAQAQQAAKEMERRLAESSNANALADPDVAAFDVLFTEVQGMFNKLQGYLIKIKNKNPKLGASCTAAFQALQADVNSRTV